jgi:hypothetical protein
VHQLALFTVVAFAVIVAAVSSALEPTHDKLAHADRGLVPAVAAIDAARQSYNETSNAVQRTLTPDPQRERMRSRTSPR